MPAIEDIIGFRNQKDTRPGWGRDLPPAAALDALTLAVVLSHFEQNDAVAVPPGNVIVMVLSGIHYYEFERSQNGMWTFVEDVDGEEVVYKPDMTLEEAVAKAHYLVERNKEQQITN